ncbi:uncharacterized protein M421DRAFT_9001 [Didymella exigua CBS 183.55]|uniref:Uncharacterized protein n=1 Tax=Didymella exigua CBS 183.55 TaxID=1150837 RepID=A0A6A5REN9_9PLEO|nr:uncharacterized protein M421DRAFT_9001 [Didymella exigua CBS 183.55]KAF1924167.1 hypothetical protein M421DRAFT_9001 [Didymella exigua CBS 183.55]
MTAALQWLKMKLRTPIVDNLIFLGDYTLFYEWPGSGMEPIVRADQVQYGFWGLRSAVARAATRIIAANKATDDTITIIQLLDKGGHYPYLLDKCYLFLERLSIEVTYGLYVLIYHHGSGADEDQFGALRAKTSFYAKWIRDNQSDELAARRLQGSSGPEQS